MTIKQAFQSRFSSRKGLKGEKMISPIKRIIEKIKTKREEKKTIEQYLRACEIFDKLKDSYGYVSVETCLWAFKDPESFFWWIKGEDENEFTKEIPLLHSRYIKCSIAKVFGCSTIVEFTEKIKNYILKGERI